jgi:hypothetical protein
MRSEVKILAAGCLDLVSCKDTTLAEAHLVVPAVGFQPMSGWTTLVSCRQIPGHIVLAGANTMSSLAHPSQALALLSWEAEASSQGAMRLKVRKQPSCVACTYQALLSMDPQD